MQFNEKTLYNINGTHFLGHAANRLIKRVAKHLAARPLHEALPAVGDIFWELLQSSELIHKGKKGTEFWSTYYKHPYSKAKKPTLYILVVKARGQKITIVSVWTQALFKKELRLPIKPRLC